MSFKKSFYSSTKYHLFICLPVKCVLKLFLIFCPGIWLLDLVKIKELLRFDIIINVAQMQLKQVVALVKNLIFMQFKAETSNHSSTNSK